jgi:hypothetical protein
MNAQGILFLNRQRPMVGTTPSGEFQLLISALDRISAKQAELWQIRYVGQRAKDLWETCSAVLTPGQPIQVTAKDMRVYKNGAVVIEAVAETIAIAPRSHLAQEASQGGGA